jgi:quinol-cytochrome oxidoreductase complex cytochrome b subunit
MNNGTLRFFKKNSINKFFYDASIIYPAPINLNYFWNFGSLAFFFLFIQILTGIFLAMHYIPNMDLAFFSIDQSVFIGYFPGQKEG